MPSWDVTAAIANLRRLLADGASDKWEFRTNAFPMPDGVTTKFFTGQTRVVPSTLEVCLNGIVIAPSGTPDYARGTFVVSPAPSGSLQTSFYYQWFTDDELATFLDDAVGALDLFEDVVTQGFAAMLSGSGSVEVVLQGLQPTVLQFAMGAAYMRKATEYADQLEASAQGYTLSSAKVGPNWKALAEAAYAAGKAKLDLYTNNPLQQAKAVIRFSAYRLPGYVPLS